MADTLNDAVQQAMLSHPDVLLNTAKSLTARQGIAKAKGAFYPSIDLAAGAGREFSLNPTTQAIQDSPSETLNRTESSVELRQNLFAGGAIANEVKRNRYLTEAQEFKTQGIAEDIALDVVNRYLTVLMHQRLYALSVQNLAAHRPLLSMIEERTKAGLTRSAEVYQSNGRLALAESNLISARSNLEEAKINYAKVVGKWPKNLTVPRIPQRRDFPSTLGKTIETGLDQHPTVKSGYADIREAKEQYAVARAAYLPRVDAILSASKNKNLDGLRGANNDRLAMIRGTYNIFRGGADAARIRETAYMVQEAYEIKNRALIDLRESIRLSWNTWINAAARLKPLRAHVTDTKQTRAAYLKQFKLNKRTLLDLLDSQNELYESEIAYEKGKMAEKFARYRIINGMGKLLTYLHINLPRNVKNNDIFSSAQKHILLNDNMDHVPYPDYSDGPVALSRPVPSFEEAKMTPNVVHRNSTAPTPVTPINWYIDAGLFTTKAEAQALANRLIQYGFIGKIVMYKKCFNVIVGPYKYKEHAGNGMSRLKELAHVPCTLVTYKGPPAYI
jgi:adhesin transport system outer membrane protein